MLSLALILLSLLWFVVFVVLVCVLFVVVLFFFVFLVCFVFFVVGAGTAGLTVADRLSENGNCKLNYRTQTLMPAPKVSPSDRYGPCHRVWLSRFITRNHPHWPRIPYRWHQLGSGLGLPFLQSVIRASRGHERLKVPGGGGGD